MEDHVGRVAVGSYRELPNFYEKDSRIGNEIFERGQEIFERERDREKVLKSVGPMIREFEETAGLYGLTRAEYSLLKIYNNAEKNTESRSSKLTVEVKDLSFLDEAF